MQDNMNTKENNNRIVLMTFGSKLYGTNTPQSDTDYKGIFMASLNSIVLGKASKTLHENIVSKNKAGRNAPDAVDSEQIELRKFIEDALNGQTYALDMLFAPMNNWLEFSDIWVDLVKNRSKLLSKNVRPYISYCRNQASKYGLKGSRLGELIRVKEWLAGLPQNKNLSECSEGFQDSEFVKFVWLVDNKGKDVPYLQVLEKKYPVNATVKRILEAITTKFEQYGARAREAMENEGIDWKAVSHAYRCIYQLEELAETGKITFPLIKADYIKEIKAGKKPWKEVNEELFELMESVVQKVENSTILPKEPDRKFWEQWILKQYLV
jgi:predicted nucleotidyltransferase